jgi:hypothetical protein
MIDRLSSGATCEHQIGIYGKPTRNAFEAFLVATIGRTPSSGNFFAKRREGAASPTILRVYGSANPVFRVCGFYFTQFQKAAES